MTHWTATFAAAAATVALLASCSSNEGAASQASTPSPSSETSLDSSVRKEPGDVKLDGGHCWVEPMLFDGERWGIPFEKQFGWGRGEPANWQGTGVMERLSEDRVRYSDDGGAVLTFLPADAPSVRRVDGQLCD